MNNKIIKFFAVIVLIGILVHIISISNISNAAQTIQGSIDNDYEWKNKTLISRIKAKYDKKTQNKINQVNIIETKKLYKYTYKKTGTTYEEKSITANFGNSDEGRKKAKEEYNKYRSKLIYAGKYRITRS